MSSQYVENEPDRQFWHQQAKKEALGPGDKLSEY